VLEIPFSGERCQNRAEDAWLAIIGSVVSSVQESLEFLGEPFRASVCLTPARHGARLAVSNGGRRLADAKSW
jgi:hypothetical protein